MLREAFGILNKTILHFPPSSTVIKIVTFYIQHEDSMKLKEIGRDTRVSISSIQKNSKTVNNLILISCEKFQLKYEQG